MRNYTFIFILFFILTIGAFFRFYKLDWGNGLYTHPDEYHIVASVNQLSFPNQMHPHFFSYGTLTIYLIYFTKAFLSIINDQWSTVNIFLLGRFYSAFFSTLTILIVYKISRFFLDKPFSLVTAFLVAITPGLIQQAHFTTPESNLIFFLFGSLLFLLYFLRDKKIYSIVFSSIFLGFALGVKISSLVFFAPLLAGIILGVQSSYRWRKRFFVIIGLLTLSVLTIFVTFALVAPYVFLDFPAFKGNLEYEGSLALGEIPAFYTRQFINTIPILFQIQNIFPFALGLPLFFFGISGALVTAFLAIRKKHLIFTILILSFMSVFLTNGFLFTKWTRFIAPTFIFFSIFTAISLYTVEKKYPILARALTLSILFTTFMWGIAFFSIYTKPDVRITASNWLEKNIPYNSTILIEGGNMVDIPLRGNFKKEGFDFYNLEEEALTRAKITAGLENADYFLVQSRRVFMNHQRVRKQFPKTAHFYDMLFTEKLGFTQIKEFHSYPTLSIGNVTLEFPDEKAEETWSVFDHPVIRIFKKNTKLSKDDYAKIFEE